MAGTRREFLAASSGLFFAGLARSFPVPHWKPAGHTPRPAVSDAIPPLPDGAFLRLGSRRFRVNSSISRFQFSPTGKILVAADRNEIRGWEVATAKPVFAMPYPEQTNLNSGRVTTRDTICVLAKPDNGSQYDILHLAFATGRSETRVATRLASVDAAGFSADGHYVAAIREGSLHVFDQQAARELWSIRLTLGDRGSHDPVFLDGDKTLAINTSAGLQRYDVATGKMLEPFPTEPREKKTGRRDSAAVDSICVAPRGDRIAALGGENRSVIHIWNAATGELLHNLKEKEPPTLLGFLPDGQSLIVSRDGVLTVISVTTGKVVRTIDAAADRTPTLSPDGTVFAVSSNDAIVLFSVETGQPLPQSADPPGLPNRLYFTSPQTLIGRLTEYGGWMQWDLKSGSSTMFRPKTLGDGVPLGMSDDARLAVVSGKNVLRRWDLVAGREMPKLPFESNRSTPLVEVSRSGGRIVAAVPEGLKVWDATGKESPVIAGGGGGREDTDHLTLSADGDTAALAVQFADIDIMRRHVIEVFDLRLARLRFRFRSEGYLTSLALSPDGSRIALGLQNDYYEGRARLRGNAERGGVFVYDSRKGQLILRVPVNRGEHRLIALSPDNRIAAVATSGDQLDLWELASGEKRMNFKLPGDPTAIAFSPDMAAVVVAGSGGPVLFWDIRGTVRPKPPKPDANSCAKLLDWLSGKDAAAAFEAMRLVAAWPKETLPILAQAIRPVAPPDEQKLQVLIRQLDSPRYAERDKATRELLVLGDLASPALRAVLAETGSEEVRQRAETILSRADGGAPADLKTARAVEAAEWAATPLAKETLKTWATGAAGARLTQESVAALARMK